MTNQKKNDIRCEPETPKLVSRRHEQIKIEWPIERGDRQGTILSLVHKETIRLVLKCIQNGELWKEHE